MWYDSMSEEAYHRMAYEDYSEGRFLQSANGYRAVVALTDSISERVVRLREQATAYGKAGDYRKQLAKNVEALQLARKHGLDSLKREAATSVGNIIAACASDSVECEGVRDPRSEPPQSFLSRWGALKVPGPAFLILVGLALVGIIYVVVAPPARD